MKHFCIGNMTRPNSKLNISLIRLIFIRRMNINRLNYYGTISKFVVNMNYVLDSKVFLL